MPIKNNSTFYHFFLDGTEIVSIFRLVTDQQQTNQSFAEIIRTGRAKARMTQQQLADALGYSRSAIVKFEKGDRVPPMRNQKIIRKLLEDKAVG